MKTQETAMRTAFGESLVSLGSEHSELVVLDADVSNSTQTVHFSKTHPERFFNVGVAEANMVDIAGGMATCGLRPVVSTFAIFLTLKAADQIRNVICYNNLPVILVGGYAGLSDSFDGASHQSLCDIAIMRALPNMTVIVPADCTELKAALSYALSHNGPVYIRASRNPSPILFDDSYRFQFGKFQKLKDGDQITICASGIPVWMAIKASERLNNENIAVDLFNVPTIKPLDVNALTDSAKKTGRVLTIEEHSVIGGLGGAVAETLSKHFPVPLFRLGIEDRFTESGPYTELMAKYGLSVDHIVAKAKELITNTL